MAIDDRDRHLIEDLLGRWCWLMDGGNGEEWAALWTDDGRFTGIPEIAEGTGQLSALPVQFHEMGNGKFRHTMANIVLEPAASGDEVVARAYSTLSNWNEGGALMGFAKARFTLVRHDDEWKIKALHAASEA